MKIKQISEDFRVDELYDLESLKNKEAEERRFSYFILTKKDYTLNRALENITKFFKIPIRDIHFAGMKDRQGITTQLISIREFNLIEKVEGFNSKFKGLNLEF